MILLDGKKLSEKILKKLKKQVEKKQLKLAAVSVGDNSVSKIYIKEKKNVCRRIGIDFELFEFSSKISEPEFKKKIKKIAAEPKNSGIIIQLPLPDRFKAEEFLNLIPREKDVDVLSSAGLSEFYGGTLPVLPPVVKGIQYLLKEYKISLMNKRIVLIGAGRLVGRPLSIWLAKKNADFLVLDSSVKNIGSFVKKADIIISGVGKPNLIKGDMVKKGATVIDVGSSFAEGKTRGDVDFKTVSKKAKYITPTIGGIGPMTVACLLENLLVFDKEFSKKRNLKK